MEKYMESLNHVMKVLEKNLSELSNIPIGKLPSYDIFISKLNDINLSNKIGKSNINFSHGNLGLTIKNYSERLVEFSKNSLLPDSNI